MIEEQEIGLDRVEDVLEIISEELEEQEFSNAEVFYAIGLLLAHLIETSATDKNPEVTLGLLREMLSDHLQEKLNS
jgi:hypothetical protein